MTNSIVPNFVRFDSEDLELVVDTSTGLAYASTSASARMLGIETIQLKRSLNKRGTDFDVVNATVDTVSGSKTGTNLLASTTLFSLAFEFNLPLAMKMGSAGANVYMLGLAGYKVAIESPIPKTPLELAKEQVRLHEQLEIQAAMIECLTEDNDRQAEIIDELFDYSSILRIAAFNKCDPKAFKWQSLKAASKVLGVEVKTAPCPNFGTRNLYSHSAWNLVYSSVALPGTVSIVKVVD